ncbi:hypothetical protein [Paraburkholderia kirstenboschensis]|uniref:Uncharacterized protein n=1 Tax=Paraburkholderia kirstenboschensis TaxID=1245436 RepID=A0ABZ0EF07_9BURK|nr:hypothetical protein [Paraburkholderia kirstenboschensis]WOD14822.1 hypothetical protein RW095_15825 [Paraburkholderia kirstenboschensis]
MRAPQSTVSDATPKLGAALRQRHVTMIALGLAVASAAYCCWQSV